MDSQLYPGGKLIKTIDLDTKKPTGDGAPFLGACYPESGQATNPKSGDSTATGLSEYDIDRIVDHGADGEKTTFRMRWYGYPPEQGRWEPSGHIPRSHIIRYYHREDVKADYAQLRLAWTG